MSLHAAHQRRYHFLFEIVVNSWKAPHFITTRPKIFIDNIAATFNNYFILITEQSYRTCKTFSEFDNYYQIVVRQKKLSLDGHEAFNDFWPKLRIWLSI
jgi:hypothetical protein